MTGWGRRLEALGKGQAVRTFLEERLVGGIVGEERPHEGEAVLHHHAPVGAALSLQDLEQEVERILEHDDLLQARVALGEVVEQQQGLEGRVAEGGKGVRLTLEATQVFPRGTPRYDRSPMRKSGQHFLKISS